MKWKRKPRILIASDSPHIDTGYARVAREIGTMLSQTGNHVVAQHCWFGGSSSKLIPYRLFLTQGGNEKEAVMDKYGQRSFPGIVREFKPDLVLAIGDEWMLRHYCAKPRRHKVVGYVPIDGHPVHHKWIETFNHMDHFVAYTKFGHSVVTNQGIKTPVSVIPHGVEADTFYPYQPADRVAAKEWMFTGDAGCKYVVGVVARNNARKNLPALLKAFRVFIRPWSSCKKCGQVYHVEDLALCQVPGCGSTEFGRGKAKEDCRLYLHCAAKDHAGHDLYDLIHRYDLVGKVALPIGMEVGHGVTDSVMCKIYNAMDVFALPTSGEGWGLPILEAMASGTPTLTTNYSGHVEFAKGAGLLIDVAEFVTNKETNQEWAVVRSEDFIYKLDMMYYDSTTFFTKWGRYLVQNIGDIAGAEQAIQSLKTGEELRSDMAEEGRKRAETLTWDSANKMWLELINGLLGFNQAEAVLSQGEIVLEAV